MAGGVSFVQKKMEISLELHVDLHLLPDSGDRFLLVDSLNIGFFLLEGRKNGSNEKDYVSFKDVLLEVVAIKEGQVGPEFDYYKVTP